MAITAGLSRPTAQVESAGTPAIYNVSVLLANTEYSQALSSSTKKFLIRVRGQSQLKLAFTAGQSGTNYITIPAGTTLNCDDLSFTGTLYFQSVKASQIVEILEWV